MQSPGQRIGITGANGFIGSHLLRSAIARGHRPIAFVQKGSSLKPIEDLEGRYERIEGDLLDDESLDRFVSQCDELFHLAGFNRYWATNPKVFHEVNFVAVQKVADECVKHGIKKIVHASSCITLGASDGPTPRTEEAEYNLKKLRFLYGETKSAGEREMQRRAKEEGLPVVIVNPTSAIGEMDYGPTPIGKPIRDIARGMWPVYVAGGACFIDVHDVVRGLWLALERGRVGERYVLAGDNLSNREFMTLITECAGVGRPRFRVPSPILTIAAHICEAMADHITREHPPLTKGMNGLIGKYLYFDGKKAEQELGFKAGPARPAIERCVQWFRANPNISL
ncbi:MAG: NAD-dependent epimerase/dehydratase family protein [Oligoflexia bacterium]|nr:NAD-dependent epimerase/dehydratase family protein [Oligoflexia bacterium]